MSQRTYHEPLHWGIRLERSRPAEALAMDLIDTAPNSSPPRLSRAGMW